MINTISIKISERGEVKKDISILAMEGENDSKTLDITLPIILADKWIYLEFELSDGSKKESERLIPTRRGGDCFVLFNIKNPLTVLGTLKMQVVAKDGDNLVWKSYTTNFTVKGSINATEAIAEEKHDVLSDLQKQIDEISENGGGGGGVTSYNDLTDKPVIPSKMSQLDNDSGYITTKEAPYIGINGNWFVNGLDTGVQAQGEQGIQGVQGEKGDTGTAGTNGVDGIGISTIAQGESYEENGYTVTPVTITKTDNSTDTLNIKAKNGVGGESEDSGNLLSEPITIQGSADGDAFKVVDFSLGMEAGKQYEIKANVDGQDVIVYGKTENPIENVVMLLPIDGGDFVMLVDQSVSLMLFDNCDLGNDEPTPADNKCLLGLQEYDEQAHLVVLNSITEVEEEYATKESVESLSTKVDDIDSRLSVIENPSNNGNLLSEPITMAEVWNFQTPIITSTLNLELGKTYKVSGYYGGESLDSSDGATPFEQTAVATTGEVMGLPDNVILVLPDYQTSQSPEYHFSMTFLDKVSFEITDTGGGAVLDDTKAAVAFGNGGQDEGRQSAKNIVIDSITEAQEEYATKTYVDEAIASAIGNSGNSGDEFANNGQSYSNSIAPYHYTIVENAGNSINLTLTGTLLQRHLFEIITGETTPSVKVTNSVNNTEAEFPLNFTFDKYTRYLFEAINGLIVCKGKYNGYPFKWIFGAWAISDYTKMINFANDFTCKYVNSGTTTNGTYEVDETNGTISVSVTLEDGSFLLFIYDGTNLTYDSETYTKS